MIDRILKLRRSLYTKASTTTWLSSILAITHLAIVVFLCLVNYEYGKTIFTSTSSHPLDRLIGTATTTAIGLLTLLNLWSALVWSVLALASHSFPEAVQLVWRTDNLFSLVDTGIYKDRPPQIKTIRNAIKKYARKGKPVEGIENKIWDQIYAYSTHKGLQWYDFSYTYDPYTAPVEYSLLSLSERNVELSRIEIELSESEVMKQSNNIAEKRELVAKAFEEHEFLWFEIGVIYSADTLSKTMDEIERLIQGES